MTRLRVAVVYALPFHRWVLASAVAGLRACFAEVTEIEHVPTHPHDWLSGPGGLAALTELAECAPDVVLVADYPYAAIRTVSGKAPIVTTRHSLAARGNTWEPDHNEADHIVTFGEWDTDLLEVRGVHGRLGEIQTGCVWADALLTGDRKLARARLRRRV